MALMTPEQASRFCDEQFPAPQLRAKRIDALDKQLRAQVKNGEAEPYWLTIPMFDGDEAVRDDLVKYVESRGWEVVEGPDTPEAFGIKAPEAT